MKRIILALILFSAIVSQCDVIVYGFSSDFEYFAFAYEPKDPMALSGALKILNVKENKIAVDTLLNEFEDSYSSLSDIASFFDFHYREMLEFTGNEETERYPGDADQGEIKLTGLKTDKIGYSINKSLNEFGFYDYSTTIRIEDMPPIMLNSRITDVYGAYPTPDGRCVIISKGVVTGFEGTFYEDFNCFAVNGYEENSPDSSLKEAELKLNVKKIRRIMDEYFLEHHEIYPDNAELLNRYGKTILNPFNKNNEAVLFADKLPKHSSKHEGTLVIVLYDGRQSYRMFRGGKNDFIEEKEE